jgi:hypothetical protein
LTVHLKVFVAVEVTKTPLVDSAVVSTNNIVKLKGVGILFVDLTLRSITIVTNHNTYRFVREVTIVPPLRVIEEKVRRRAYTLENLNLGLIPIRIRDGGYTS